MNDNPYAAPQADLGVPEIPQSVEGRRWPRWLVLLGWAWLVQCALAVVSIAVLLLS